MKGVRVYGHTDWHTRTDRKRSAHSHVNTQSRGKSDRRIPRSACYSSSLYRLAISCSDSFNSTVYNILAMRTGRCCTKCPNVIQSTIHNLDVAAMHTSQCIQLRKCVMDGHLQLYVQGWTVPFLNAFCHHTVYHRNTAKCFRSHLTEPAH